MAGHDDAAIRHGINIGFAEGVSRVESDGEPKRSRAAQREAEKHSRHEYAQRTHRRFPSIAQVHRATAGGERATEQKEYPPNMRMASMSALTAAIPHKVPSQKSFSNACAKG